MPRRIEPDRLLLFNFGLATITGLFVVVAAALALEKTFETRGRRVAAAVVVAAETGPAGDAARVVTLVGFGVGNFAVTADDVFR